MVNRVSAARRRAGGEGGFTLIELLVVIVILGILAGVVVFAVSGINDKGERAASQTDERTLRTAQEAFFAKNGHYGTEQDLIDGGFLSGGSALHDIRVFGATLSDKGNTAFKIGLAQPNGGTASSIDNLNLQSMTGFGVATPFKTNRGPGQLVAHYSFDTLLWRDGTGQPVPWLAKVVPTVKADCATNAATHDCISPDGKTWKLTLRDNVKWQDEDPAHPYLTPADVRFSYDYYRYVNGTTGSSFVANGGDIQNAANTPADPAGGVKIHSAANVACAAPCTSTVNIPAGAIDDTLGPMEVRFNLNKASQVFINGLQSTLILPKHIWEQKTSTVAKAFPGPGDLWAFRGTGPYKLRSVYTDPPDPANPNVVYEAFQGFWGGVPYVRQLTLKPIAKGGQVEALTTGAVDASGLGGYMGIGDEDPVTTAAIDTLEDAGFNSIHEPGNWSRLMQFNHLKGHPYTSVAFRQAVAYALDRSSMVQTILNGRGVASPTGGLAASNPWLAPNLNQYQDDAGFAQARALLDQVFNPDPGDPGPGGGFRTLKDGTAFDMEVFFASDVFSNAPAQWIEQRLEALGVSVTLLDEVSLGGTQTSADTKAGGGNYEVYLGAVGGLTGDPDTLRTRLALSVTTNDTATPTVKGGGAAGVFGWGASALPNKSSSPYTNALCPGMDARATCFDYLAKAQQVNTSKSSRLQQVQLMQQLVSADMPFITMYTPDSYYYFNNKFTPWYFTPGSTPVGPNSPVNKQVLVTGMQFGSPNPALGL